MTAGLRTRRVYSAEELHRLRSTCSQPKLREAIEAHDGDDAELVKEHVLRGTRSFAARSFRSRASANSLRVPSNKEDLSAIDAEITLQPPEPAARVGKAVLDEVASNRQILRNGPFKLRPSPTPSLKKKKAEAIVKAHGSPQHVRVTAGGRIVPSEQSPLCHPRYGYSAVKVNGGLIKFAPNHPLGKAQWTQATQNGFVAQDINGRLCQIVNGTILPLNEVDGTLRLYVPAPNLNVTTRGSSYGPSAHDLVGGKGEQHRNVSNSKRIVAPEPSQAAQANALELEYSKVDHELKELEKTEVLHGRTMGKVAKDALFAKRRELVTTLDNVRKALKSIKTAQASALRMPLGSLESQTNHQPTSPPQNRLPSFLRHRVQQDDCKDDIDPVSTINSDLVAFPPMPPGLYFGLDVMQPFASQSDFQSSDSTKNGWQPSSFPLMPPAMFVSPPAIDSSVPQSLHTFHERFQAPVPPSSTEDLSGEKSGYDRGISVHPQTDGGRPFTDFQRKTSPKQSHALEIKAPEPQHAFGTKSSLNPMSPIYKPGAGVLPANGDNREQASKSVKGRTPTPLSPLHQLKSSAVSEKHTGAGKNSVSPSKKSAHVNSSSVSSFDTADFFPRNTREYSIRKYAYPDPGDVSEDKENMSPSQLAAKQDKSLSNPTDFAKSAIYDSHVSLHASGGAHEHEALPPPRQVSSARSNGNDEQSSSGEFHPRSLVQVLSDSSQPDAAIPNREMHNLSPKNRLPDYLRPSEPLHQPAPPDKLPSSRRGSLNTSEIARTLDFSAASFEWIEGYRAGLACKSVDSNRTGGFLDGYCAGLLKSKHMNASKREGTGNSTSSPPRQGSPTCVISHSNTDQSHNARVDPYCSAKQEASTRDSLEFVKRTAFAPQNETAVLSPAIPGSQVDEQALNPSGLKMSKMLPPNTRRRGAAGEDARVEFPFQDLVSTADKCESIASESIASRADSPRHLDTSAAHSDNLTIDRSANLAHAPDTTTTSEAVPSEPSNAVSVRTASPGATSHKSGDQPNSDVATNRVISMSSIDASLHRQWPGQRIFSPHLDWKSATSVAQAAGLAAGLFSNCQTDGAPDQVSQPPLKADAGNVVGGTPNIQVPGAGTSHYHGRFREGSIDGLTNPPNSPQATSPPMSPSPTSRGTPSKKKDSPSKNGSPAKAKFEHIAEKVGIKVSGGGGAAAKKEGENSPTSPPGKRRWRDVWRGGSRKDAGNEDEQ